MPLTSDSGYQFITNQKSPYTVKKGFLVFPSPSRDVTYQTLSGRKYVSLIKSEVFPDIPSPSPEFSQNPFESDSVPVHRQEFSRIFLFSRREFFPDL
jgi:hypothetical protein